jgi:hypothetical protein
VIRKLDCTPEELRPTRARIVARSVGCLITFAFASLAAMPAAHAQVTVSVTATDAQAGETPPNNGLFTVSRSGGDLISPATITYELSGTATPGADYAALSGSVTLGLFQSSVTIPVNVTGDDGLFEGDEFVAIRLTSGASIVNATAQVDIADSPHSVTAATGANATEGPVSAGRVVVSLSGQNQSGDSVIVDYTVAGTATEGTDFAELNGVVSIPNGATTASIEVTPIADDLIEGDETVEITLTTTSDPRAPVGNPAAATLTIEDDDAAGDEDGDGLTNGEECPDPIQCRDTDDDGTPDYQDPDDDNDGVPTADENPPDQDTNDDGIPDYLDADDDGDGRPTADEDADEDGDGNPATDPTDIDEDGVADYLDEDDQGGPTGDLDGDGLTNAEEEELGTDPANPDTDGDGVNDGDENDDGTDPLDHMSFADADGDLVPDAIEAANGSDPTDPMSFLDSDGGSTADHIESIAFPSFGIPVTDVQDPGDDRRDFDGDGLPDLLEIANGADPASSESPTANGAADDNGDSLTNAVEAWLAGLGISPVDAVSDFDRDGSPDVAEIRLAQNPLSATEKDSDGDGISDVIELLAGADTDSTADSDADGIPDAREIAHGWDPLDGNSPVANGALDDDGDGVSNAIEHVLETLGGTDVDEASDIDADGVSDADEIRFGTNPLHHEQPVPWIQLTQADIGPVSVVSTTAGSATATAVLGGTQSDTLTYDWSGTDNAVLAVVSGSQDGKSLVFAPETLPPGAYNLVLTVERTVGDVVLPASTVDYTLNVLAEATDIADADNDGIPDSADDSDARKGFPNTLQAQGGAQLMAEPGVRLQLGSTARTVRANSAQITRGDIASAGDGQGGSVGNSEDDYDYLSGIFDFEVTNLPQTGVSVQVVIPQATAIGEFPEYRMFLPGRGWGNFVEDAGNTIHSAPGTGGECPAPGADAWQAGLTPGHLCVQLTIEDGGPNDADADAGPNGIVKDPGGVGTPKGQVSVGQGSGSMDPGGILILVLVGAGSAWRARKRRGRRQAPRPAG